MRDSIVFYRSYYEAIKELPDEQKLQVYEAIMEYGLNENEVEISGIAKAIYNLVKPTLNSANARYEASIENGKKGGRPKKENLEKPSNNLDKTQAKPNNNLDITQQKPSQNLNDNVNDNDNYNDNVDVVMDFYLNNINSTPVAHEVEILESYEKELPPELICYAMEKAVENKSRSIAYIKAILNSWKSKGITTLSEAKEERKPLNKETETQRFRNNEDIDLDDGRFYANFDDYGDF